MNILENINKTVVPEINWGTQKKITLEAAVELLSQYDRKKT